MWLVTDWVSREIPISLGCGPWNSNPIFLGQRRTYLLTNARHSMRRVLCRHFSPSSLSTIIMFHQIIHARQPPAQKKEREEKRRAENERPLYHVILGRIRLAGSSGMVIQPESLSAPLSLVRIIGNSHNLSRWLSSVNIRPLFPLGSQVPVCRRSRDYNNNDSCLSLVSYMVYVGDMGSNRMIIISPLNTARTSLTKKSIMG
jgi:hypothetical protein